MLATCSEGKRLHTLPWISHGLICTDQNQVGFICGSSYSVFRKGSTIVKACSVFGHKGFLLWGLKCVFTHTWGKESLLSKTCSLASSRVNTLGDGLLLLHR